MDVKQYTEIVQYLNQEKYPERCTSASKKSNFRKLIRTHNFHIQAGHLYVNKSIQGVSRQLLVIQQPQLKQIWKELHRCIGHAGRDKTIGLFTKKYWFKGYYTWISNETRECLGCSQKRNYLAPKKIAPLKCIPVTAQAMVRIHIDLTEGFTDVTIFKNQTITYQISFICSYTIFFWFKTSTIFRNFFT